MRRHRAWAWALASAWLASGHAACSREDGAPAPQPAAGASAASEAQSKPAAAAPLPPRRAIAGLAGFQIDSRVVFDSEPEKPHTLSATFLFPERVRLRMALEHGDAAERVLAYRCGSRGFFIGPRESASRELLGTERGALVLQTELRRALFLWPDGFAWAGSGSERRADLGALGSLRAELDGAGRPSAMHSIDASAAAVETLRGIAWKPRGARQFPSHFELWAGGERIWVEDVDKLETALDYIDAFFLPPDRRGPADPERARLRPIDAPGGFECRIALPGSPPPTWTSAFAAAQEARASWAGRGLTTLEGDWIEVDASAAPMAVILRASAVEPALAADWSWRDECPAWELSLAAAAAIDAAALELLLRAAPSDPEPRLRLERLRGADKTETFRLIALPGLP